MSDRAKAAARYNTYAEKVKAAEPPHRLLIHNGTEGWAPLCDFLGVALPDEPLSNLNDRETIKKIIRDIIKGSYIMLGLAIAAVAAMVAGT
ncbi:hypothetical protein MesoLj113b_28020 [Mesorhizobium sp. 113-3-3]|nr:hypothetical protein MesoLj113b_28020 [Mesorhizobium sp. 113-3-3]